MSSRPGKSDIPPELRRKLRLVPDAPGVYLHKDGRGKVIYVGKALRLKNRVRSYFGAGERDPKTEALVRRIRDFDYIVTADESGAFVLENQLIKEYRPRYNVNLKDDKQYPYIRISVKEPFPRVTVVRRIADDGARYFGPYTNVTAMRESLKTALRVFRVRTCHLDLPEQTVPRACLDYQIGRCSAPCVGYDDRRGYRRKVKGLIHFLEGSDRRVRDELEREMEGHAAAMDFEQAAAVRDRLAMVEKTTSRLSRVGGLAESLDACAVARDGGNGCGVVLRIREGKILTSHHFLLQDRMESEPADFLAHLLREYYGLAADIPARILVSHELPDAELWREWIAGRRGGPVKLHRPARGARRDAVAMAEANATFKLNERALKDVLHDRRVAPGEATALQQALDLRNIPATVECFDISTFQGRESVGSLVFFRDGAPLKSRYRRFRIKTVSGVDDFAMMREVLDRYYARLVEKELPPADLVMVDGGAGQISAAREVLTRHGLHETELIGLAKREEEVHREGGRPPVRLARSHPGLKLLQRVRDEAHRFAITYHRLLRDQRTEGSLLDAVPGIGRVKKLALLHHFDSVSAIREAGAAELSAVRGLNRTDVQRILEFFAAERGGDRGD